MYKTNKEGMQKWKGGEGGVEGNMNGSEQVFGRLDSDLLNYRLMCIYLYPQ